MPVRDQPFVTGNYYHVFNRGVAKQKIFFRHKHYRHLELTCDYYQIASPSIRLSRFLASSAKLQQEFMQLNMSRKRLVEVVAYCFMPNHYHLLLKQLCAGGISDYMRLVGNSYTRYFNTINERVGPVFQGRFKSVLIDVDEYLLYLSRYIHLNPLVAGICTVDDLKNYPYSSLRYYLSAEAESKLTIRPEIVLDQFNNKAEYGRFCLDMKSYEDSNESLAEYLHD